MKAHELNPNCFYRAERERNGRKITDVAFAGADGDSIAVSFCREIGPNPLAWDYFGPLTLQTGKEVADMVNGASNPVADQTPGGA